MTEFNGDVVGCELFQDKLFSPGNVGDPALLHSSAKTLDHCPLAAFGMLVREGMRVRWTSCKEGNSPGRGIGSS